MKKHSLLISILIGSICFWGINLLPENLHYLYWLCGAGWGLFYIYAVLNADTSKLKSRGIIAGILLLHLSALLSGPILEDDYYRYSWDGRNVRMGVHPYNQSPYEQVSGRIEKIEDVEFEALPVDEELKQFPDYTRKINYPMYRTVYPPLCEMLFTSEILVPDSHLGWPLFILLTDLALIYLLLYKSRLSFSISCLILVNPLLVKEGLNSLHFDFFLVPLLIYFLFSKKRSHPFILGLMTGIRPWYLALFLWQWKEWKLKDYVVFSLTLGLPWLFLLLYPGFPSEGFSSWKSFVNTWEFNAIFYEILRQVSSIFTDSESYFRIAAWVCGFSIIGIAWRKFGKTSEWGLAAIAGWILFLPTVNPWYLMPIATVLAVHENKNLKSIGCAICVCLPLAYIHYEHFTPGTLTALSWSVFELITALSIYFYCYQKLQKEKSPSGSETCEA